MTLVTPAESSFEGLVESLLGMRTVIRLMGQESC